MKKTLLTISMLIILMVSGCSEPKNIRHFNSLVEVQGFVQSHGVGTHDLFQNEHGQWVLIYNHKEVN